MKKIMFFMLISLLVISIMIFFGRIPAYADKGVDAKNKLIKVAVVGAMTGQYAVYGQDQKTGIEFCLKKFNEEGGIKKGKYKGYKIQATYFDDKGDPKESANIAQQIVIGDFFAEMGPSNSSPAHAMAPIFERQNMPMILIGASDYRLTHSGYKNVFRLIINTKLEAEVYAKQVVKIFGAKKISAIWENTAYGQTLEKYFVEKVKELGGEVISSDTFVAGQDVDFKPMLTKIRQLKPDMIMLLITYNDAGLVVSQAGTLGYRVPMLAAIGCDAPKFVEMMPEVPGDIYMAVIFSTISKDPKNQKFVNDFKAMFGVEPSLIAPLAFDAMSSFIHSMEMGAVKREEIKNYMRKIDFQGITNRIKFDEYGDTLEPNLPLLKIGPNKKWLAY